jgi:excisionase family DNA binding protein
VSTHTRTSRQGLVSKTAKQSSRPPSTPPPESLTVASQETDGSAVGCPLNQPLPRPRELIDVLDNIDMTLEEAAKKLGVHIATVHRWRLRGALQCTRVGSQWRTSEVALRQFLEQSNERSDKGEDPDGSGPRSPAARRRASERAAAECKRLGC